MSRARLSLEWLLAGAGVGLVLALALPLLAAGRPLTVLSGSMEPALMTGDVVVVQETRPLDTRPGDIVTFREPKRGTPITHRVVRMRVRGDVAQFVTRGDANRLVERWQTPTKSNIRVARYRVPKLGYVFNFLRSRTGLVVLVAIPLGLLLVFELWSIWRPEPEADGGPAG